MDAVVRFGSLGRQEIATIVRLELAKVDRVLREQDLRLVATDAAVQKVAEMGWDPQFGARPVKRVIQRDVQDLVADGILAGERGEGIFLFRPPIVPYVGMSRMFSCHQCAA